MQAATQELSTCPSQRCNGEMTPAWLEGYRDGLAPHPQSAPDMRRGRDYAMGWLTARYSHQGRDWLGLLGHGPEPSIGS